jgi:hypothetical protein
MNEVLTKDLRNQLKELIRKEIEQLPEQLKEMVPKERLDILLKLIAFILAKVSSVSHSLGEPFQIDW